MNKRGSTIKEILIVIAVFSIIYFAGVIGISFSFSNVKDNEYENVINLIEKQAFNYASENKDSLFENDNVVKIYVKDLLKNGYLIGNENGDLVDPRDINKTLNDLAIEITNGDKIEVSVKWYFFCQLNVKFFC